MGFFHRKPTLKAVVIDDDPKSLERIHYILECLGISEVVECQGFGDLQDFLNYGRAAVQDVDIWITDFLLEEGFTGQDALTAIFSRRKYYKSSQIVFVLTSLWNKEHLPLRKALQKLNETEPVHFVWKMESEHQVLHLLKQMLLSKPKYNKLRG